MNRWVPHAAVGACALLSVAACEPAVRARPRNAPIPTAASDARGSAPGVVAAAPGVTRAPTARESQAIARLMRAAERVRELRFKHSVPVLVQDRDAIIAYAQGRLDGRELRRARTTYVALGLLPADIDLPELLLRLLGEQVIGYYDDRNARLIVRDEVMAAFEGHGSLSPRAMGEARMTLVHELVHALQDQHLDLGKLLGRARDTDPANAFKALYEGDAMLAMSAFAKPELEAGFAHGGAPASGSDAGGMPGAELAKAPAIVRTPLLFAYLQGMAFAAHLFAHGGWERIDRAYREPPVSTAQVLHPQSGPSSQRVQRAVGLDARQLLAPDLPPLHQDTLGELELSVYFSRALTEDAAQRAAAGWAGDRLFLYAAPDAAADAAAAAVWVTSWDSIADAREAADAAERVRAAEGSLARSRVTRSGRHVLIVRHATDDQHARAHARFVTWTRH